MPGEGGLFGKLSERFSGNKMLEEGPGKYGLKYLIYVLAVTILIATIVIIVDQFFPFLPINPVGGPSAAARAGKVFWRTLDSNTENMIVPASDSPTKQAALYTMSVQMIIGDSRTPSLGKYRHIVHRGSNPCGISAVQSGSSGHAGVQVTDVPPSAEQTYTELGIPAVVNPGLFLDRYKNDLHVFVHTLGKEGGMDVLWLESLTVEDLPLGQPITVGVVCSGKQLEVYLNCRLYSTLLLKGIPYLPKADNQWFGRYCAFPMSGLVKHLQLWDTALNSSDYMKLCGTGSFDASQIPTACATANSGSCPGTGMPSSASSLSQKATQMESIL